MDVDPVALRRFAVVADHLHFVRAAAALGISRQRLSRTVVELEAELGVDLFVRPSERTELTEAGRALREEARTLWSDEDLTSPEPQQTASPPVPAAVALSVAIVPGVTVSRWSRVWSERRPGVDLVVSRVDEDAVARLVRDGEIDLAFARLPVDGEGLSLIPLYTEVAVVVLPQDHELTLLEEVSVDDLVDEDLLQDPDSIPAWREAAALARTAPVRPLPAMRDTADAIALVAAGLGLLVVPQSVARLHHRKDLTYRPVRDLEGTQVALAWRRDAADDLVEEFIGIVRGRSARSSRSGTAASGRAAQDMAPTPPRTPTPPKAQTQPPARRRGRR